MRLLFLLDLAQLEANLALAIDNERRLLIALEIHNQGNQSKRSSRPWQTILSERTLKTVQWHTQCMAYNRWH